MSYASRVLYAGDGVATQYNIPFPYLSASHLMVLVNEALQLNPMHYTQSGSTITFDTAPEVDAAIEIKRNTSPTTALVDFQNGSVLGADELNTSYLHNFYLFQETQDGFAALINAAFVNVATGVGIIATETQEVIAALVNEMLSTELAAYLQQRVNDIDSNGKSILQVQTDVNLLGVSDVSNTAFILNSQTVKIDSSVGETMAAMITRIAANETSVTEFATAIDGLGAKYGVSLNVNGYITGFVQNNDGDFGNFVILADRFAIVDPSGDPLEPEFIPFSIDNGKIVMTGAVSINGSLILNGTILGAAMLAGTIGSTQIGPNAITTTQLNALAVTAAKISANAITADKINVSNLAAVSADLGSITAGNITLNSSGYIKGGQTAYNTGSGFFLGYSSGYKFSIGNGGSHFLTWDGTTLIVKGNVRIGLYTASDNVMLTANTARTTTGSPSTWEEKKAFTVAKSGTVRVKFSVSLSSTVAGLMTAGQYRILVGGVQKAAGNISTSSPVAVGHDVAIGDTDTTLTIELQSGERNTSEPVTTASTIQDCTICADSSDGESVDTD